MKKENRILISLFSNRFLTIKLIILIILLILLSLSGILLIENEKIDLSICNGIQELSNVSISSYDTKLRQFSVKGIKGKFYAINFYPEESEYDLLISCDKDKKQNWLIKSMKIGMIRKVKLGISLLALGIGFVLFFIDFKFSKKGLIRR